MTDLYQKYRPRKFAEVLGQPEAVKTLSSWVKSGKVPRVVLLQGPSGVGKTTLARILKEKLGCGDGDFAEINCAQARGIDMVRDISRCVNLAPMSGRCRIWLLDECFPAGTQVVTRYGLLPIEVIRQGHLIQNAEGWATVAHVFRNQVALDRIVKLHFDDGTSLITTRDHRFMSLFGWVTAQDLRFEIPIFRNSCYIGDKRIPHEDVRDLQRSVQRAQGYSEDVLKTMRLEVETHRVWDLVENGAAIASPGSRMFVLQTNIRDHQSREEKAGLLLQKLRCQVEKPERRLWSDARENLPRMREGFCGEAIKWESLLQSIVCCSEQNEAPGDPSEAAQQASLGQNQFGEQAVLQYGIRQAGCGGAGQEHDGPFGVPRINSESTRHQKDQRYFAYLEGQTGRQRSVHPPTNGLEEGSRLEMVEVGATCFNGLCTEQQSGVSKQLQSRHRQGTVQNRYRSRWERPSVEKEYLARCQKNLDAQIVRVVRVEVYQPGHNDSSFVGVVSNQDRRRGFAEFYDLQVDGHPSYFANGFLVHNCAKLSGDAQAGCLKLLEDVPGHVHFILATTDPAKLLPTIITRCKILVLRPLAGKVVAELVRATAAKEGGEVSDKVIDRIVEASDGSARKALNYLEQARALDEASALEAIIRTDTKRQGIEIARALIQPRTKWAELAAILKEVEDEPETVRHIVLGYAGKVILDGGKLAGHAYLILTAFEGSFFESKKAGLVRACWEVLTHPDREKR